MFLVLLSGIMISVFCLDFVDGIGGPYPPTFDCPMRQLALEFAQEIQPWLTKTSLQQIADALNGSPEATNHSCTNVNRLPTTPPSTKQYSSNYKDMYTVYVSVSEGIDSNHANGDIKTPFKSLQFDLDYIGSKHDVQNEWKQIILREGIYYLQDTIYFTAKDSNLIIKNYGDEKAIISGAIPLTDLKWNIYKTQNSDLHVYSTSIDLSKNNISSDGITGLRVNNTRAIRARYPNANPEQGFGSTLKAEKWLPPKNTHPEPDVLYYPDIPYRNITANGYFQHYNLGIGGVCNNFNPPAGYWCSTKTQGGGPATYRIPTGLIYTKDSLPNAPYWNPFDGIVQAWRPGHWASWMFEIDGYDATSRSVRFGKGGFQGARGNNNGAEFYVENIFEELDSPNEWYYNKTEKVLYYYNNYTDANTDLSNLAFEATKLKVLMNYTSSMTNPVKNIIIDGVIIQDSAYTYMDPHCMPSGGDWALQRTGAIYLDGTENITISNNLFQRLDGIAVSINRYNRNLTIYRNEFVWIGSSVIASMGDTEGLTFPQDTVYPQTSMGYDGTNGNQPRFLNISYNIAHEIGIWEKQSSLYFQSKSCQNVIYNNIFYNGPRAGININDGFGGNSKIYKNLLFNTCRESGDHGPINTWDRQVYITSVNDGTPSFIKAYDHIYQNFLVANYDGLWPVDNDDGSSYYLIYNNFQVYANGGLKNNFGGHNIRHYNNIFGYVESVCMAANNGNNKQLVGYVDQFSDNICVVNGFNVDTTWGVFDCSSPFDAWPILGNNSIYLRNETNVETVGLCGLNEKDFQQKYKTDLGTAVYGPSDIDDSKLISAAKVMLFT